MTLHKHDDLENKVRRLSKLVISLQNQLTEVTLQHRREINAHQKTKLELNRAIFELNRIKGTFNP